MSDGVGRHSLAEAIRHATPNGNQPLHLSGPDVPLERCRDCEGYGDPSATHSDCTIRGIRKCSYSKACKEKVRRGGSIAAKRKRPCAFCGAPIESDRTNRRYCDEHQDARARKRPHAPWSTWRGPKEMKRDAQAPPQREESTMGDHGPGHVRTWAPGEDAIIEAYAHEGKDGVAARIAGRSVASVQLRASHLGISLKRREVAAATPPPVAPQPPEAAPVQPEPTYSVAGDPGDSVTLPTDAKVDAALDDAFSEAEDATNVRTCRVCGCTDAEACEGGCWWVDDSPLCSTCAQAIEEGAIADPEVLERRDTLLLDAVEGILEHDGAAVTFIISDAGADTLARLRRELAETHLRLIGSRVTALGALHASVSSPASLASAVYADDIAASIKRVRELLEAL